MPKALPYVLMLLASLWGSQAAALPLSELEAAVRNASPEQRLAALEAQALEHRLAAVQAQGSVSLVGGASLADAREAVTDTTVRDYRRVNAQIGLRWSLLAAERARELAGTDALGALEQARLREREAEGLALRELRRAYVEAWHGAERAQLSDRFLQGEATARRWLQRRTQAHLLLESDRLGFVSMFDLARREQSRDGAAQEVALRQLRRLTGQPLPGFVAELPGLAPECASPEQVRAAQRPAVAQAQAEVQLRRERLRQAGGSELEVGVSLMQALSRDINGPPGRASTLALDFSMPLGRGARDARRAEAEVELRRAEFLLETRTADDLREVELSEATLETRVRDIASSRRQFEAAEAAWRIASLRLASIEGDVLERELQARYALYQAAMSWSRAHQLLDEAVVDWLALLPGAACGVAAQAGESAGPAGSVPQVLRAALGGKALSAPSGANEARLGFFAWEGEAWLKRAPWQALPAGSKRLALSFKASEIERLGEPARGKALHYFLSEAHRRGFEVEWLLGEPSWVQPAARPRLLGLVRKLAAFPFDALNLDLERSQLPPEAQADWPGQLVATIREVREQVPWPLVLTTHHREFADQALVQRLFDAGLSEGVAMIYVSRPERAAEIARPLLQGPIPLHIAQSIEPGLPPEESSALLGRQRALAQWRRLSELLANEPGFQGVTIQSWESFREVKP